MRLGSANLTLHVDRKGLADLAVSSFSGLNKGVNLTARTLAALTRQV